MSHHEAIFGIFAIFIGCSTIVGIFYMANYFKMKEKELEIEEMKIKKELGIKDEYKCMPGMWSTITTYRNNEDNHERQTSSDKRKAS